MESLQMAAVLSPVMLDVPQRCTAPTGLDAHIVAQAGLWDNGQHLLVFLDSQCCLTQSSSSSRTQGRWMEMLKPSSLFFFATAAKALVGYDLLNRP